MKTTDRTLVPLADRRRRKRILTLRNFRNVGLLAIVVVAGLNIRSEMRDTTGDEYGRLYGRAIKSVPAVASTPSVAATVEPIDESASADPFALDAARREQYLGRPELIPVPEPQESLQADLRQAASGLTIVGDAEGVTLVTQEGRGEPVLGGGFGRQ